MLTFQIHFAFDHSLAHPSELVHVSMILFCIFLAALAPSCLSGPHDRISYNLVVLLDMNGMLPVDYVLGNPTSRDIKTLLSFKMMLFVNPDAVGLTIHHTELITEEGSKVC